MGKKFKCLAVVGALFLNLIAGLTFGRVYADSNSMTVKSPWPTGHTRTSRSGTWCTPC